MLERNVVNKSSDSDSLNDETEIELDSEEERDIVKQIKEEITNQVSTV